MTELKLNKKNFFMKEYEGCSKIYLTYNVKWYRKELRNAVMDEYTREEFWSRIEAMEEILRSSK